MKLLNEDGERGFVVTGGGFLCVVLADEKLISRAKDLLSAVIVAAAVVAQDLAMMMMRVGKSLSPPSKNPITGIPAEGKEFPVPSSHSGLISEPLKQNSVKPFSTKGRNSRVDGTSDETPKIERHQADNTNYYNSSSRQYTKSVSTH
ncbi:hypothetical protein CDAR_491791 [Caerostris darwini]|uniref:Uncharacterized protein n=1 Tax=Caerostris darwini TaxID=1538125 RepID=A0AAV4MYC2_9ARAC|nr:hypothetical protein CDAR_491791 [Caerostris darwini]